MLKALCLTALLAAAASSARADALDLSAFGGYTSLGMKQVNSLLSSYQTQSGYDQATTDTLSNGFLVGAELSSGALIPIPFLSLGLRAEYVGADRPGEAAGTYLGQPYQVQEDPFMADCLLGLEFGVKIPGGLKFGLAAYGGYGEGLVRQNSNLDGYGVSDLFYGGGFVGEGEARLRVKLYSVLGLYAFGGMRWAALSGFKDPAGLRLTDAAGASVTDVDFGGVTGGLGVDLDF